MPTYSFHYRTRQGALVLDRIGHAHENDEAAVIEAILTAAELMRGNARYTRNGFFEIRDDTGQLVDTVPFWQH